MRKTKRKTKQQKWRDEQARLTANLARAFEEYMNFHKEEFKPKILHRKTWTYCTL